MKQEFKKGGGGGKRQIKILEKQQKVEVGGV